MHSITVNQQHLEVSAAPPEMVAAVELMLKSSSFDQAQSLVPTGKYLKGVIYVFGNTEPRDAGTVVLQKIEEAGKTLDMVTKIHHEISLVRDEHRALRTAKARLEQMQAEKLFAFTDKIDADSFRILCAVL